VVLAISAIALSPSNSQILIESAPNSIQQASNLGPQTNVRLTIENPTLTDCLSPNIAVGTKIHLVGAYEGGIGTQLSIEDNKHDVGRIKLHAKPSGEPIILVVSAYDPVIWDFSEFPVSRLKAVLASGYHDQAVAGLPRNIPLRINSYQTPNARCGKYGYAYKGGSELDRLVENISMIFGRRPDSFQGDYDPKSFVVDGQAVDIGSHGNHASPNDIRAAKKVSVDSIPPKESGLVQLVNSGNIRPANANDIYLLSRALTAASPNGNLASVELDSSITHRLFVVLKPTTLPKGMYGAHLANFIIPSGVPTPIDPGSHNTFYRLADGGCMGTMCNN
jgi:hypothetical protein